MSTPIQTNLSITLDFNSPEVRLAIENVVHEILHHQKLPPLVSRDNQLAFVDNTTKAQQELVKALTTPTKKEVSYSPPLRDLIPDIFTNFIMSGDISELASDPDVKTKYKNIMFAQINDIKGRTLYAAKASTQKPFVGIMKEEHWHTKDLENIKGITERGETINVALLISGTKPEIVLDMMIVPENWSSRGRLFNSLWRKDQE